MPYREVDVYLLCLCDVFAAFTVKSGFAVASYLLIPHIVVTPAAKP